MDGSMMDVSELIRERILVVEGERAEFALAAGVRAEERMREWAKQLDLEIGLRLQAFDERLAELRGLIGESDGVGQVGGGG